MNRHRYKHFRDNKRIGNSIIFNHIKTNINIYVITICLFLVGIIIGTIIVNSLQYSKLQDINTYINNSVVSLKDENSFSKLKVLKKSLIKYFFVLLVFWTAGLTLYGKYLLYFLITVLGIMLGYTTSSILLCFDFGQSLIFIFSSLFIQNIVLIPTLIVLCVQGIHGQQGLTKNYNCKAFFMKYTTQALFAYIFCAFSSLLEAFVSGNLVTTVVKYF